MFYRYALNSTKNSLVKNKKHFHVQLLFQVTTESYLINSTANNNTLAILMCANLKMNQETIRVLLKKKKLKQTKANKNVLHQWEKYQTNKWTSNRLIFDDNLRFEKVSKDSNYYPHQMKNRQQLWLYYWMLPLIPHALFVLWIRFLDIWCCHDFIMWIINSCDRKLGHSKKKTNENNQLNHHLPNEYVVHNFLLFYWTLIAKSF